MQDQHESLLSSLRKVTKGQVYVTGSAFALSGIADLALHGDKNVVFIGLLATGMIAHQSNNIFQALVPGSDAVRVVESTRRVVEHVVPLYEEEIDQSVRAKLGRLIGIKSLTSTQDSPTLQDSEIPAKPKGSTPLCDGEWEEDNTANPCRSIMEGDDEVPMPDVHPTGFTFSQILAKGFRPSLERIYLGTLDNGTDVIVPVESLCHVALAGLTGNGKGNIMRLIMSQLCSIGVRVLLLNPHYAGYDQSGGEDWTPFEGKNKNGEPFLQQPPLPCSEETTIAMYLEWMAQTLLPQRKALAQQYKPIGRPYFVVVDEWPDVVKECAKKKINVVEHLEKLLREGRKYGVYVVVASQDFQVKTIGVEGGGVRKCFKTVLYVGGDSATARALLGDDIAIPEKSLGHGVVMLRCNIVTSQLARVPYVDNDALYQLLGSSQLPSHILRHGVKVTMQEERLPSVLPEVTSPIQKLQAPSQELHGNIDEGNQVSFEDLCNAVVAMAGYSDEEIMRILRLDEEEYLEIVDVLDEVGSRFRSVAREVPDCADFSNSERNPRVVPGNLPKREDAPEWRVNELTERVEGTSDTFIPGEKDLLLSEVHQEVLKIWYRENRNVDESLAQIRNEKGQGLGGRYFRHASFVLEQAGLKKKRA